MIRTCDPLPPCVVVPLKEYSNIPGPSLINNIEILEIKAKSALSLNVVAVIVFFS